jgi:hypothetical protein
MKPGHVPTAVVGPLVARLMEEGRDDVTTLALRAGCDWGTIIQVVEQEYEGVSFDIADKLLCALGCPDLVPMPEVFMETCAVPACQQRFVEKAPGGHVKRCCCRRCASTRQAIRKGKATGQRLRQRGYCLKGHRMAGDNLRIDKRGQKVCKTCQRDYQREWARKRRMTDPVFLRKSTESKRRWRERQKLKLAA